jgi:hypothetical protein
MAKNRNKRLRPQILQEDLDAFAAVQAITDYHPSNPAYSMENVEASKTVKETKQTNEVQKQAAADAARDAAVASEWDFHDLMLGVKIQLKAQYGEDSDEYASTGMKKKSEYKSGGRHRAPEDNGTT